MCARVRETLKVKERAGRESKSKSALDRRKALAKAANAKRRKRERGEKAGGKGAFAFLPFPHTQLALQQVREREGRCVLTLGKLRGKGIQGNKMHFA